MLSTGILSAMATLGLLGWIRSRAPSPTRCNRCGYDLGGLRSAHCPECGSAVLPRRTHTTIRRTLLACLAVSLAWACTATTLTIAGQSTLSELLSRLESVPVQSVKTTWTFRSSVAGLGRPRAGQPLYLVQLRFDGRLNGSDKPISGVASVMLMHADRSITFEHALHSEVFSIRRTDLFTFSRAAKDQSPETVHPLAAMDASFVRTQLARLGASLPAGPDHIEAEQEVHLLAELLTSHLASPTLPGRLSHPSNPAVQFTLDTTILPTIMLDAAPEFGVFHRGANALLILLAMVVLALMWRWIWSTLRLSPGRIETPFALTTPRALAHEPADPRSTA